MEEKNLEQEIAVLEERLSALKEKGGGASRGNFFLVFSVIAGAMIIGGAIMYSGNKNDAGNALAGNPEVVQKKEEAGIQYVKPITTGDHLRGNINAPVQLIEFSDTECPFCKRFHETMKDILESSGGEVAWVYRHFPLDGLHPRARKEAEALECANELSGNGKFWEYIDRLFEITPSNNGLDPAELPNIAQYVGLDRAAFEKCLASGRYAEHVEQDVRDAQRSGGRGTPYTVILKNGVPIDAIEGALPYYSVKLSIEEALR